MCFLMLLDYSVLFAIIYFGWILISPFQVCLVQNLEAGKYYLCLHVDSKPKWSVDCPPLI